MPPPSVAGGALSRSRRPPCIDDCFLSLCSVYPFLRACPITMEAQVITVPRSIPRPRRCITRRRPGVSISAWLLPGAALLRAGAALLPAGATLLPAGAPHGLPGLSKPGLGGSLGQWRARSRWRSWRWSRRSSLTALEGKRRRQRRFFVAFSSTVRFNSYRLGF